jgi:hypothetical protein
VYLFPLHACLCASCDLRTARRTEQNIVITVPTPQHIRGEKERERRYLLIDSALVCLLRASLHKEKNESLLFLIKIQIKFNFKFD